MSLTKEGLNISRICVSGHKLIMNVFYEGIGCKPYPTLPRNAQAIFDKVTEIYKREFEKITGDFYLRYFDSRNKLMQWLNENIRPIREIQEMNLTQYEVDNGVTIENREIEPFNKYWLERKEKAQPVDYDFIDIDAFIGNLANNLIRENIEINYSTV